MSQSDDLLGNLLDALQRLPGVGRRSAQRMALHLLRWDRGAMHGLGKALVAAADGLDYCKRCRNLAVDELCAICASASRDQEKICVVEQPSDLLAFESANAWSGCYFVTHGAISPVEGRDSEQLHLDLLLDWVREGRVREVVVATNSTLEGDVTAMRIKEMLAGLQVEVARIASGVPMGGELEYQGGDTLARSLAERRRIT